MKAVVDSLSETKKQSSAVNAMEGEMGRMRCQNHSIAKKGGGDRGRPRNSLFSLSQGVCILRQTSGNKSHNARGMDLCSEL